MGLSMNSGGRADVTVRVSESESEAIGNNEAHQCEGEEIDR